MELIVLDNAIYKANIFIICQTSVLSLEDDRNFYQYLTEFVDDHDDVQFKLLGVLSGMFNSHSSNDVQILNDIKETFSEDRFYLNHYIKWNV